MSANSTYAFESVDSFILRFWFAIMFNSLRSIVFLLLLLSCCQVSQAGLVITEIMSTPSTRNGAASGGSNEWFEIFNTGPTTVNLATIRYDIDGNASNGTTLGGNLVSGGYAIIGNRTLSQWQSTFGTLPSGAIYYQATTWRVLYDTLFPGESLDLYSTTTNSTVFSIKYPTPTVGKSFQYVGTSKSEISPFVLNSTHWVVSSSTPAGSTDAHSAGRSNLRAAPEPAAVFLAGLSCLGLLIAVRRQRSTVIAS